VRIWKAAFDTAAASGSSAAQPIEESVPLPGRMTINAPMKPPATSSQRSRDTRSCSQMRASSVAARGVSMTMAVNSATGMRRSAAKAIADENASSAPRAIWNIGLAVRKVLSGDNAIHTDIASACSA
jgi:hypothetical protein